MSKFIQWTTLHLLVFFSPALFALGLGGADVQSYLDRPLDVRIELISNSSEELQSVTAGLASAKDFELLGMSRNAITAPLEFELVTDAAQPYIHITSQLNVSEPVVQILVEVIWASGRMLREYTLFLDPPTFESPAPPVTVNTAPRAAAMPPEQKTTAAVQRAPVTPEPETQPEPEAQPEPEPSASSTEEAPEQAIADDDVEDTASAKENQQPSRESQESTAEQGVYGPVASGETLWGIARDFSRGSGYSINQTMLALQRKNPDAFINNNINSLKRGAILRLPALSEVGELSSREAMLEVMRQAEEKRTGISSVAQDFSAPTVADIGDYQETEAKEDEPVIVEQEAGHLELVPPAEEQAPDAVASDDSVTQGPDTEVIREELSRTEEELVNVKQENAYLEQRIQELEAQVAEQQSQVMGVEDSGLAAMESKLAEDRASGQPEPELAITPGGEAQPWYAGITPLIIGGAVVFIALIVWALRRRSAGQASGAESGAVAALALEAEEIRRNLDKKDDDAKTVVQKLPVSDPEPEQEQEPEPAPGPVVDIAPEPADVLPTGTLDDEGETVVQKAPEKPSGFAIDFSDDDLDVQPSEDDPEVKLDLARAYLSLGDKEASKAMLDEVLKNGSDAQKLEAKQMLDEF